MKAAVFKAFGQPLKIETLPDPVPRGADVVVKVERCGICGSDLRLTENPSVGVPSGTILGHEYAGEVVETGPDVQHIRRGERVSVLPVRSCGRCPACIEGEPAWCARMRIEGGGYAEYSVAHERQCLVLPKSVSLSDGALIEPLAVGLHGLNVSGLASGARVLVIGAGPIGLATAFWARRMGAGAVAVTAKSCKRAALAMELGATAFLDPAELSIEAVHRALRGLPDIVFECAGKPGLIQQCVRYVRPRGTVVVLGLCLEADSITPFLAVTKQVRIQPAMLYSMRDFETAAGVMDQGIVTPRAMVTDTICLDDLPATFEQLRSGTHQCKVLIAPWQTARGNV